MRKKIFISYRREDEPGEARSIHDRLAQSFGESNIFMDVDNLVAGVDFQKELDVALDECAALIAVIGPEWESVLKERCDRGGRDYVADEVGSALASGVWVIPVLVNGATPPDADSLPAELSSLAFRQAYVVSHEKFSSDVTELARIINQQAGVPFAQPARTGTPRWVMVAMALVAAIVIGLLVTLPNPFAPRSPDRPEQVRVVVFTHDEGLTETVADGLRKALEDTGARVEIDEHVDRRQPDAIYIAENAPVDVVRKVLRHARSGITHIFPVDYSTKSSVEMRGVTVAVGLMAGFEYFDANSAEKPYPVQQSQLDWLVEDGLDQEAFVQRLRYLAPTRQRKE